MAMVRIMVSVRVKFTARVRVRVRAEWATEESPKHRVTAYVRVYFKLKYTGYIFHGIFCPVYFVRYILSRIYCPVCLSR